MKRLLTVLTCFLFFLRISAQHVTPVQWTVQAQKVSVGQYQLKINVQIRQGWHLYVETDPVTGTEASKLSWDNEQVKATGKLSPVMNPIVITDPLFQNQPVKVCTGKAELIQPVLMNPAPAKLKIKLIAFVSDGNNFEPIEDEKEVVIEGGQQMLADTSIVIAGMNLNHPVARCGDSQTNSQVSYLRLFLLGFIGGLIALLTPCVFPMIPVTLSFFTHRSPSRKKGIQRGLLYGSFIWLIYLLISLPFHLLDNINPQLFNSISTNAWVNCCFFAIFLYFSLSFFGLFEISLPSFITNSSGQKSDLASLTGIFFMALTLVTVSFSCTGPILGSLLVGSISGAGGAWQLSAGLAGFGAALALPFAFFAMFPQLMKQLPKSGGWMETVKKSLAFIELALAFKFLSNADLVEHWGVLKREVFVTIWLLITLAWGIYLLGFFNRKETPVVRIYGKGRGRYSLSARQFSGILVLIFGGYLLTGLIPGTNNRLALLSGLAPPFSYSLLKSNHQNDRNNVQPQVLNDYKKALQLAKEQQKPLLIDFTGLACVNCRKMEEHVWTQPPIRTMIQNDFILVSLYVDDPKKLPAEEQFLYSQLGKDPIDIRTTADKWALFESVNFAQVSQPLYVILSPDEQLLTFPVGFTPDVQEYKRWLECGLSAARSINKIQASR